MKYKLLFAKMLFISMIFTGCTFNNASNSVSNSSSNNDVVVTDIKIEDPEKTTIIQDETLQLKASLTPNNANKTITWTSSDTDIASVNELGLVTGLGVGNVTISASVPAGEIVKTAKIDLTINPNVRNILNVLSTEVALNGTYQQIKNGSSVVSIDSELNLYYNNKQGSQEYYLQELVDGEEVDSRHYYGNDKGELVKLQINRLNEVEETNFVHQGESTYILFNDFITTFSDIKDSEVKIKSFDELEINLTNNSSAKDLIYSLSFYETDLTEYISIILNKFGEPTNIVLEGSYVDTDYNFTYLQTLEFDVVTKDDIQVPNKPTPYAPIEGNDATLVNNFLTGLKNRNYTLDILVNDVSTIKGMVTPNNVLMSDSNNSSRYFSYISDKGVYEVSFNEDENSIIPRSENNIANTMDDFLTPIDFSKDLFSPIGNNKYKLLYGLDSSGLLMGLDPSIPFFDTYNSIYTIRNLDSVNITLNHEGDKITSAEITYDGRLFVYLSYQIKIEITDIGNTKVPFENATIKDYVIPTSWSTLDNGWYQNTNTLLECEIDNIPYLQVDWTTYIEENRSLVQSSPMEKEMADSLLSQYISSLESSSWAKTDDVYSDKTSTIFDGVYCKDGENVIVAVDEFTSSENYYLQVVFLPSTYFVLATSWEEVDSEWFKEINDYLGDDISGVPYIQGNWNVYTKEYDYYYAEIEFVSLAEYEEFVSNFMEEFENAGWFESEDYVDYWNSEMVYENDDYSFYIYIDSAANEERDDYYLIINFLSEDFDNEDIDWA